MYGWAGVLQGHSLSFCATHCFPQSRYWMSPAFANQPPFGLLWRGQNSHFSLGNHSHPCFGYSWLQGEGGASASSNPGMMGPSFPWLQSRFGRCSYDLDKSDETQDILKNGLNEPVENSFFSLPATLDLVPAGCGLQAGSGPIATA